MIGAILAVLALQMDGMFAAATRVAFDENQVMVINGQRVFPIGVSLPPPPEGVTPAGKNGLQELAEAGVMFLRTGVFGRPWDDTAIERETFRGLPQNLGEGEVLFEEPRKVKAEGGSFADWFGPLVVHVYRFRS